MLARGHQPVHNAILSVRELTRDDLEILKEPRVIKSPHIRKLRDPHHNLARLLASGLRQEEAGRRAGYSYNRVHLLLADPSFKDLVERYRALVTKEWLSQVDDFYELATSNMLKAERQIAEHLEAADEADELLPVRDLISISRDAADRFGYGKKAVNLNINADFAAQLEKAITRSGKVIEGERSTQPESNSPADPPRLLRRA